MQATGPQIDKLRQYVRLAQARGDERGWEPNTTVLITMAVEDTVALLGEIDDLQNTLDDALGVLS